MITTNQITMVSTEGLELRLPPPVECGMHCPEGAWVSFRQGVNCCSSRPREYEQAVLHFTEYIKLTGDPVGYEYRIRANTELGDWPWILDDYNKLVTIDPLTERHWFNRAGFKFDAGDYEGAISDLDRALELKPRHVIAYQFRGDAHFAMKNAFAAINDYTRAWQVMKIRPEALVKRGIVKLYLGDETGAQEDFAFVLQMKPRNESALVEMGTLLSDQGRIAEALSYFMRATKVNRRNTYAFMMRANCNYDLCKFRLAEKDCSIVIRHNGDIDAYWNRGLIRYKLKKYNLALEDINIVFAIDCLYNGASQLRDDILDKIANSWKK